MGLLYNNAATKIRPTLASAGSPRRRTTYRQPPNGPACLPAAEYKGAAQYPKCPDSADDREIQGHGRPVLLRDQHEESDHQDEDEVRERLFSQDSDSGARVARELVQVDRDADEQQPDQRGGRGRPPSGRSRASSSRAPRSPRPTWLDLLRRSMATSR
jgi:hypothetical protein